MGYFPDDESKSIYVLQHGKSSNVFVFIKNLQPIKNLNRTQHSKGHLCNQDE